MCQDCELLTRQNGRWVFWPTRICNIKIVFPVSQQAAGNLHNWTYLDLDTTWTVIVYLYSNVWLDNIQMGWLIGLLNLKHTLRSRSQSSSQSDSDNSSEQSRNLKASKNSSEWREIWETTLIFFCVERVIRRPLWSSSVWRELLHLQQPYQVVFIYLLLNLVYIFSTLKFIIAVQCIQVWSKIVVVQSVTKEVNSLVPQGLGRVVKFS